MGAEMFSEGGGPKSLGVLLMKPSEALRELSRQWTPGDHAIDDQGVKAAIQRAARHCGLEYWRCFDIWYDKARRVDHDEIMAIEDALAKKRAVEAENEIASLKLRIARLEAVVSQRDQSFYRPTIDWSRKATCRSG